MNPQNGQTPVDYLNQIAPQAPKKPLLTLNLRTIIFFGLIAIALVIILAVVAGAISSANKSPWQHLSARLTTTTTLVDDASTKIKDSQLRSYNSDLKLYLTNTGRDLTNAFSANEATEKKIPKAIAAKEASDAIAARIETGRLNAKFDSTYSREMAYLLSTILTLYQQLYNGPSGSSTKTLLEAAYNNLVPIQESFANFTTSHE